MSIGPRPVTKQDQKLAKKHVKETIKLEKKKVSEHQKAMKKTSNKASKNYNLAHIKGHQKDIKERQQYAKKIGG